MDEKFMTMKTAMAAFGTALGAFLGWKGVMLLTWVAGMALDYLSGTAAACKDGQWCSAVAREGLWHKSGMIFAVMVAAAADWVMALMAEQLPLGLRWPGLLLPLVLAWYTLTELGSVLENAVKLGAKVPQWLVKLLKTSLELVDKQAEDGCAE